MIFQITLLWLTLALSITSQKLQTAVCTQKWNSSHVSAKEGPLEDVRNFIQDGKKLTGDVTSGNINQMCVTKIYF